MADEAACRTLYLALLERSLLGLIEEDEATAVYAGTPGAGPHPFDRARREQGRDWPSRALSMIGVARMENIRACVEDVLGRGVPGDLIEAGVWRGGAAIFMRGVLAAHGVRDRRVWVADSFEGLPLRSPGRHPLDAALPDRMPELEVGLGEVRANFARYGLLDEQVRFLPGWFREALPRAPIDRLAVVRLDGDLYESTMDGLTHLYPKLSAGGYLIVDDYGAVPGCRQAVTDYRERHGVREEIVPIDWTGVYWRRER